MTKLQRNIYQEGKRIWVKKVLHDNEQTKSIVIPVKSVHEGVTVLDKLKENKYEYSYGLKLMEKQRVKHGLPIDRKGHRDMSFIIRENNKYTIQKVVGDKKFQWNFKKLDDAIQKRDELVESGWKIAGEKCDVTDVKFKNTSKQKYARFEEVKDFPSITLPKKEKKKKQTKTKPPLHLVLDKTYEEKLRTKATKYNIDLQCIGKLCMEIGLHQLERLNFIPEYEQED